MAKKLDKKVGITRAPKALTATLKRALRVFAAASADILINAIDEEDVNPFQGLWDNIDLCNQEPAVRVKPDKKDKKAEKAENPKPAARPKAIVGFTAATEHILLRLFNLLFDLFKTSTELELPKLLAAALLKEDLGSDLLLILQHLSVETQQKQKYCMLNILPLANSYGISLQIAAYLDNILKGAPSREFTGRTMPDLYVYFLKYLGWFGAENAWSTRSGTTLSPKFIALAIRNLGINADVPLYERLSRISRFVLREGALLDIEALKKKEEKKKPAVEATPVAAPVIATPIIAAAVVAPAVLAVDDDDIYDEEEDQLNTLIDN